MLSVVADILTASRVLAAVVLVWLAFQGPGSLTAALVTGLLAWMTDQLDGWAARRSDVPTRLGRYDFIIDATLYGATLAYLGIAGFVPAWAVVAYAVIGLIIVLAFRRKAMAVLVVRLIDLAVLFVMIMNRPQFLLVVLLWLVLSGVMYRRRIRERVPRWAGEVARLTGLRRRV